MEDKSNQKKIINVKVKFFADFYEITKIRERKIELTKGGDISQLLKILFKLFDIRKKILDDKNELRKSIHILKNGRQIQYLNGFKTELNSGDVVAFFPPVSGG